MSKIVFNVPKTESNDFQEFFEQVMKLYVGQTEKPEVRVEKFNMLYAFNAWEVDINKIAAPLILGILGWIIGGKVQVQIGTVKINAGSTDQMVKIIKALKDEGILSDKQTSVIAQLPDGAASKNVPQKKTSTKTKKKKISI
jgi:hypothetical protein